MINHTAATDSTAARSQAEPRPFLQSPLQGWICVGLLAVLLAGCEGSVNLTEGEDEISDVFILELNEETGPIDDGLSADEPVFHFAGDYEVDASGVITNEPAIGAALDADPVRKQEGAWTSVFNWPVSPIHMALLPDDTVLTYGTNPDAQNATAFTFDKWFRWRGTDSDSHETSPTGIETNLFCSAQSVLPDGKLLVSGGDGNQVDNQTLKNDGIDATTIFDYQTNLLFDGPTMHFPRWYPTLLTLADGRQLALGGRKFRNNSPAALTDNISIPPVPEVYDPETGQWSLLAGAANQALFNRIWYYPRAWLRHNGKVVVADIGQDRLFELSADGRGTLTELGEFRGSFGGVNSPAAMFEPGRILFVSRNKRAEILDISGDDATLALTASSLHSRSWADATVLANGEVFLSGGIETGATTNSGDYPGEIWNPDTGQWTLTAKAAKARLYHSTAILLPNGRVLTAGGGPPGPVVNMNAEVFIPPYLFDENGALAQRPSITTMAAPDYASEFFVRVGSDDPISKVSFIRSGSATHSFDQSQRYMELAFEQNGDTLTVVGPDNPNIAPPGLYMLFVFDQQGVPSHAKLAMLGGDQTLLTNNTDPADTDPDNLLINGGFESGKSNWIACAADSLSQITDQSNHGSQALRQTAGACLYQEVSVIPGATYTLTCDAKNDGTTFTSININMLDSQYNELLNDSATVSATDYQTFEQRLQAPANAAFSAVTFYSEGQSYFDSCLLKADETSVTPVTPPASLTIPADNLLTNSSFEQGKTAWNDCAATELTSVNANQNGDGQSLRVENAGCIYQEFPVTAGEQYELQCLAQSEDARYSSITLQISDDSFTALNVDVLVVTPGTSDIYQTTIAAPANSAVGAVTLYSEDASDFDACIVVRI